MKNQIYTSFLLFAGFIISSCNSAPPLIKCDFNAEKFKENIKIEFSADSVLFYSKHLQEEAYFPELISLTIIVENPTILLVDFKALSLDEPYRFENWDEVDSTLKKLGEKYALEIIQSCDMTEFNDIIIEFGKRDYDGRLSYRFICHYDELLIKN